ncbi:MAG TPA: PQQ-binding-like beta-propeller repeat protein [Vicinamibacteria bacterium]|nr:PQQ-binding-like beta-propeller repeat protein [Vicinamibacteria bacterium]
MQLTASLSIVAVLFVGEDWPQWRGPNRDGLSRETGLVSAWPQAGPPLVWTARGLGTGYSTVTVSGARIFTLGASRDREFVIALDERTGKELWRARNGPRYQNNRGDGPRGAPTVDGDRLYALGGEGDLSSIDVASGKVLWHVNLLERFRAGNISWGISESPLVLEDRVLVNAGGRNASIVALDKNDGSVLWTSESDEAGYSSAVIATIRGVRQAVFFTGERALGVRVDDGSLLWSYRRVSNRTANIATPIVRGNHVFVSSDYGTGCALLEIDGGPTGMTSREVYFNRDMKNHHSSSVLVGDTLYGFSSSILTALDFATGEVLWRDRSVGKGSLVYADGHLYAFSEDGVVGLIEANPAEYREKGRFELPARSSLPSWSHPVISDGRLYLRDQDTLFAYSLAP